jgi:protein gp37
MKMAGRIERMTEARRDGGLLGPMTHYADTTKKVKGNDVWTGKVKQAFDSTLTQPLRWKSPRKIFVNSMGDLFHESIPDEWIDRVVAVMALSPQHTFQVLTKRADRMRQYLSDPETPRRIFLAADLISLDNRLSGPFTNYDAKAGIVKKPLPNVWLGVSTEDQRRYDERKDDLRNTPAAVRFFSMEPLLSGIKADYLADWVIVGGESGPGARPMHPDWARSLRDQCAEAGVPFFFKQHGEWIGTPDLQELPNGSGPGFGAYDHCAFDMQADAVRVGKKRAGRLLDGKEHNAFPEAKEVAFA